MQRLVVPIEFEANFWGNEPAGEIGWISGDIHDLARRANSVVLQERDLLVMLFSFEKIRLFSVTSVVTSRTEKCDINSNQSCDRKGLSEAIEAIFGQESEYEVFPEDYLVG